MNNDMVTKTLRSGSYSVTASMSRQHFEDLKTFHNIDAEAELIKILEEELNKQMAKDLKRLFNEEEEVKRVYSDIDPYGEENWDE